MKRTFVLLAFTLLLFSCKKESPVKKDFVEAEFVAYVGLDSEVSFTLLNGSEELYSNTLIGTNLRTEQGHSIGTEERYTLTLPIEKAGNLILKYGIEIKTKEQGGGGWLILRIDGKTYFDDEVIAPESRKNIHLNNPLYSY